MDLVNCSIVDKFMTHPYNNPQPFHHPPTLTFFDSNKQEAKVELQVILDGLNAEAAAAVGDTGMEDATAAAADGDSAVEPGNAVAAAPPLSQSTQTSPSTLPS